MKLFNQSLIDKLNKKYGAKRYSSPSVFFLATNPRAKKERQRLEDWFKDIPDKNKNSIKGRLISEDDANHFSAYNELVIHRFLSKNT